MFINRNNIIIYSNAILDSLLEPLNVFTYLLPAKS